MKLTYDKKEIDHLQSVVWKAWFTAMCYWSEVSQPNIEIFLKNATNNIKSVIEKEYCIVPNVVPNVDFESGDFIMTINIKFDFVTFIFVKDIYIKYISQK